MLVGNDSGLWRSTDGVGETGQACSAADASHFQNLNGGLGSLAEVVSMSAVNTSPYTMMTGLGANGTAGVKSTTGPTVDWPEILGGEGGPVAVDPANNSNWYVNNQAGVSIHLCSETGDCTPSDFGMLPVVNDADVNGDGGTMTAPAPFLVDPLDASQLLVGTCRLWRGPADGSGWSARNAISPILDGVTGIPYCSGDALIRSMAAMAMPGGGEVIYVGMYGAADGGGTLAGHVLSTTFNPGSSTMPVWTDLSHNAVTNDTVGLNAYGLDISSIYIDPHDATGNTVYVTVDGVPSPTEPVRVAYRSTDGGAHWAYITSNLRSVAGQQPGGGSAGCEYRLHCDGCRSFFDTAGRELRDAGFILLVGFWNGFAGSAGGGAERGARNDSADGAGGGNLWTWRVADSAVDCGHAIDDGDSGPGDSHLFCCRRWEARAARKQ